MIKGSRIVLKLSRHEDTIIRYGWFNDPEFTKLYLGRPTCTNYRQIEQEVMLAMEPIVTSGLFELAVHAHDGDLYIGNAFFRKINLLDRSAEFGIFLGNPEYRGKKFGEEIIELMLDYGFQELGLHRIWLTVLAFNHRAIRCFEKCGFRREGVFREAIFSGGIFNDVYLMAILENERSKRMI